MKFLSSVLSFIFASAYVVLNSDFVYANVSDEFEESLKASASPECMKDLEAVDDSEYIVCKIDMDDYKSNPVDTCNIFNNNCKPFFEDPLIITPHCKDNEAIKEFYFVELAKSVGLELSLSCLLDENGKICPISEAYGSGKELTDRDRNKIFRANCKSKRCTEGFIEINENFPDLYKKLDISLPPEKESAFKEVVEHFKSKECTALYETSNAISNVKVETTFIIIFLGLLLFSLC